MDVGGRATSGTVAEVETRPEQRSRSLSLSRSQNLKYKVCALRGHHNDWMLDQVQHDEIY